MNPRHTIAGWLARAGWVSVGFAAGMLVQWVAGGWIG